MTKTPKPQHPLLNIGSSSDPARAAEFEARMQRAASRAADPRGEAAIIARDLELTIDAFTVELERLAKSDPIIMQRMKRHLSDVIAKSQLLGSLGPLANATRKVVKEPYIAGASAGGKAGAKTRLKKAEEGWRAEARRLLLGAPERLRKEGKSVSQDNMVTDISALWTSIEFDMPSLAQVKRLIRQMQAAGELPSNLKKHRS